MELTSRYGPAIRVCGVSDRQPQLASQFYSSEAVVRTGFFKVCMKFMCGQTIECLLVKSRFWRVLQ